MTTQSLSRRACGRAARAALAVLALVPLASCGYSLAGRGSYLPAYIRTIGVPTFGNATTIFDLEQTLTQRVRAEFIGRGRYTVVPERTGADAVLEAEITSVGVQPTAFNDQQQASKYLVVLTMRASFRDLKQNRVLWENQGLVFREEYELTTGSGALDAAAFFGQSSNAVERMSNDVSRTIVSSILEAF